MHVACWPQEVGEAKPQMEEPGSLNHLPEEGPPKELLHWAVSERGLTHCVGMLLAAGLCQLL